MYATALDWVRTTYPYFNASRGADHIWLFTHDEGACWAPKDLYEHGIILSHWGRHTPPHQNHYSIITRSQYNYSAESDDDPFLPGGFHQMVLGHPCYTPGKDLVLPALRAPPQYKHSPYFGGEIRQRDILLLLVGDLGDKKPLGFSRGLRQDMLQYATAGEWRKKYGAWIGTPADLGAEPSALYARAQYCLIAIEDGWSAVFEDAVSHGCIPVVVEDDIHLALGGALRHKQVMVRIPHELLPQLPIHLQQITAEELQLMRWRIDRGWWRRMLWLSHPAVSVQAQEMVQENERKFPEQKLQQQQMGWWRMPSQVPPAAEAAAAAAGGSLGAGGGTRGGEAEQQQQQQGAPLGGLPSVWHPRQPEDDAFGTMMQWLYHKLQQRIEAASVIDVRTDKPGHGGVAETLEEGKAGGGAGGKVGDGPNMDAEAASEQDHGGASGGHRRLSGISRTEEYAYDKAVWGLASSEVGYEYDLEDLMGEQLEVLPEKAEQQQLEAAGQQRQQTQHEVRRRVQGDNMEEQEADVRWQQQQVEPSRWQVAEPPLPVKSKISN
jgi:hypothetical protein